MIYGILVGPCCNKFSRLHLPRFLYGDIPHYANATGGDISNEFTRTGIEDAYNRLLGAARNQYTLGYITPEPLVGQYNEIEIRIERPSCRSSSIRPCADVTAKAGYYAMPPAPSRQ